MKKMMMLMLLVVVMGMGMSLQSCSKEETTVVTRKDITFDKELDVTKQELVQYELIMSELSDRVRYMLFKDTKAAYIWHDKSLNPVTNFVIFKSWSLSNGKLTLTAEKDGKTETTEFGIKKIYEKVGDNEYVVKVRLTDEEGHTDEFYASDEGKMHDDAESWWKAISE